MSKRTSIPPELIMWFVLISALFTGSGLLFTHYRLKEEQALGQGKAYVLTTDVTVEDVAEDGLPSKCLLAKGDCVRIDEVEAGYDDPTVSVTYAPVVHVNPAEDRRCAAGTVVTFTETGVKNMVGK